MNKNELTELHTKVMENVSYFRNKYNIPEEPIKDINSLAFAKEFFIVRFPFKGGISGAYLEKKGREKSYRLIYLNTIEPIGRLNFNFFHEIYHAYFEKSDTSKYDQRRNPIEKKANMFASEMLIPKNYLVKKLNELKKKNDKWIISINDIFELQRIFNVSFQSLIYTISTLEAINKPKNIKDFIKYYDEANWEELEKLSLEYGISLNSCNPKIEWPLGLKENILANIENGLIVKGQVEDLFEFFDD